MILRSVTRSPLAVVLLPLVLAILGVAYQPEFTEPIVNLTIPVGRDATFRCLVHHLGGYRVGWVKADTKAIQAIHDHVITHNPRVGVSHTDHTTWNLHIKNIQEEDRGQYMCQINTDPMKSQLGVLEVVVPPDFVAEETSGDIMVPEGGLVKLTCKAYGHPEPHVQWRREDGNHIIIKEPSGLRTKVLLYQGELLRLVRISRSEMGAYMCIASNGIPPTVSKRIMVNVHFHPVIQVPNQLVGAPLATDVTLECFVEASPRAINYWVKKTGEMVITSSKYEVEIIYKSMFEVRMTLMVRNLELEDIGTFKCIAKNSIGEVESSIRIYEIPGPTKIYSPPEDMEEGDEEKLGSAERDGRRLDRGKLQNTATALAPRDTQRSVIDDNSARISSPMILITILLAAFLIFIPLAI
ncbi:PREDICTED: lachesin-like isoform X3 [Nicrophorus vespilloides]|uniref:Lachesin-like isoform X3 n=1 Tax=Nicrophorus vespilloides TaxID=110193 RepID=A0ABM1MDH1_NICVS|nr:PREDICTED: lachesin-like isoform X3 [Nicrophorus vespilloides]